MVKIRVSQHMERFHFSGNELQFSSINYSFSSIPLVKVHTMEISVENI